MFYKYQNAWKNIILKWKKNSYVSIKEHFETKDTSKLRGNSSRFDVMLYAVYIAKNIGIEHGGVLDFGCGDGLPILELKKILPELDIQGLEQSKELAKIASINNPTSKIYMGSPKSELNLNAKYNVIYSFSVAQYFSRSDLLKLNMKLSEYLIESKESKIIHMSIPNWHFSYVNHFIEFKKQGKPIKFLVFCIKNFLNWNKRYGTDGSRYHNPIEIIKDHSSRFIVEINEQSDSYYRFDFSLRKQ